MRKILVYVGLVALVSAAGWAQTALSTVIAMQPDAPAQIVTIEKSATGQAHAITVRNTSDQAIMAYQIGWVAAVPKGCSVGPQVPVTGVLPVDDVLLDPGDSATAGGYKVDTERFLGLAKLLHAPLVDIQIGVVSVTFLDGHTWKYDVSQGPVFNQAVVDSLSSQCTNGKLKPMKSTCQTQGLADFGEPLTEGPDNLPRCYYVCQGSELPQICTNRVSQCTLQVCGGGQGCPNQVCFFYCDPQ